MNQITVFTQGLHMNRLNHIANIYRELLALVDQAPKNRQVIVGCKSIAYDLMRVWDNSEVPFVDLNEYFLYLLDMQEEQSKKQMEWLNYQAPLLRKSVEEFIHKYAAEENETKNIPNG
jgi:hypothetical protein